jgi:hypothetical protein
MGTLLSATAILNAKDCPTLRLEVPEWDGDVLIARLGLDDIVAFHAYMTTLPPESLEQVARLCVLTLVNEDKVRLFSDETIKDLGQRSPAAMFRVYNAALQHNRMGEREVQRAEGESEPSR